MQMIDVLKRLAELDATNPNVVQKEGATMPKDDPRDNLDRLDPDHPGNSSWGRLLKDKIKQRTGQDVYGKMGAAAGDAPRHHYATRPQLPGESVEEDPDLEIAKQYAELMGYNPEDMDEIGPLVQVMKSNPSYRADIVRRVKTGDDKKVPFSESLEECGMMPGIGMTTMPERPSTPATINMTAGSADELGNLLKDIVSLAGLNKSEPEMPVPLGAPSVLEPADDDMGPPEPGSAVDSMRSVIDKLNPMDGDDDQGEEEPEDDNKEKVDELDNEPSDPTKPPPFNANQYANNENQPGQGDRMDGNMPKGNPEMNFESLMAEYKKFIREDETN